VLEAEDLNIDERQLVIKAIQDLSGNTTEKKLKNEDYSKSECDLRYIVEEGRNQGKSAYDALKDKGYIKGEKNDTLFKAV
jgi:hypothetical protein